MDQLERLRAYVLVAERGSFAEAARELRKSPTAVTRAVAGLEDALGVQLLRRTTRSVRLTDAGAIYLDRAKRALADLDDAARLVAGEDSEPHGTLVVSAPMVFGRLHVVPVVATLLAAHPRLDIRLTLTDRVVRLIDEGIDVAVRIADLGDSRLRAARVGEVRRILVAAPAYLAARGAPQRVSDLPAHDLIAFEALSLNNEWRFGGERRGATARFEPRLLTNNVEAAITAARLGGGIARLFDYQVVDQLRDGSLVQLLPEFAPAPAPVSLVYPADRHALPGLRAFIKVARSSIRLD